MRVSEAVAARRSIRAFLDRPVADELVREVLELASRAPSGGNLQPWQLYVVTGEALRDLKALMQRRLSEAPAGEAVEYDIYPPALHEPYRSRRYRVGEALYGLLGIPRHDREARLRQFARNYEFFGAPLALFCFVDRRMGPPQWADLGMYLQTVMLLLKERGLDSCAQECWSLYNRTISRFVDAPAEFMLFCGMAIGYADPAAAVNDLVTERAPLEESVRFLGTDRGND